MFHGVMFVTDALCAKEVLLAAQVEQRMVDGLLALVAAERGGEPVDRGLLSNLLRCFTSLGTYTVAFQVGSPALDSLCRVDWRG